VSSLFLYFKTDDEQLKVVSLFLLFVGQMQLFDYIFWKNQECNEVNYAVTKLAILFNHFQPIILFLLLEHFKFKHTPLSLFIFVIYVILKIKYNENALNNIDCTLPSKDKDVMDWKWNKLDGSKIIYGFFLAYLSIASFNLKDQKYQYLFSFINLFSFYIATKTPILNYSVGRIWCYYASFVPLLFLLLN